LEGYVLNNTWLIFNLPYQLFLCRIWLLQQEHQESEMSQDDTRIGSPAVLEGLVVEYEVENVYD